MKNLTVKELREILNTLDSKFDNHKVGRSDGSDDYWGSMFSTVSEAKIMNESISGPKNGVEECFLLI